MNKRLKISMVSYLNSKPFILGMELANLLDDIELHLEVPSKTAQKLIKNKLDAALIPVAVLPKIKGAQIITDYCISADGKVDSVYLFSNVPVEQIRIVHLDSHSRTSGKLVQVLFKYLWQNDVEFIENSEVHDDLVNGTTACLMIGDKAIQKRNQFAYKYDLAQAWKKLTGLPFVFAVWISTKQLDGNWESKLNSAFEMGMNQISKITPYYQKQFPNFDIETYLSQNIQFKLTKEKARALDLFLNKMKQLKTSVNKC